MSGTDPYRVFAEALTDARHAKQLTQRDLARRIGVSTQSFSNWETGESSPRFENALKWAAALGYDLRLTKKPTQQDTDD